MMYTDKNIIVINEVDSTNNYAKQLILTNAAEKGTVVLAHYQNAGKGQQGNYWESEAGKNLLVSTVLTPNFLIAGKQFYISKIVSLALVEFLKNEVENVSIKWPNDIYVGDKKIAGILIENSIKGKNLEYSIVGVGLNLNQEKFMTDAPNPVSLKQLTGKDYNIEVVTNKILELFYPIFEKLKSEDLYEVDRTYFLNLFRKEKWCMYRNNVVEFEARIIGIGEFGQLKLEERSGKVSEYMFKEVEFVL